MPIWTASELEQIAQHIKNAHLGFATQFYGIEASGISEELYKKLVEDGYITSQEATDYAFKAYQTGYLQQWIEENNINTSVGSLDVFDEMYAKALEDGMSPLTPAEIEAVEFAKHRAARFIVGLGNKVAEDYTTIAIESEHQQRLNWQSTIGGEIVAGVIKRRTVRQVASAIGDATGDWSRDLHRIAATELEHAYQSGYAAHAKKAHGDGVKVAKHVNDDACKYCKILYGEGADKKIFPLSELEANGTNYKKKRADWLPVVGPTHPFCHCTLIVVPDGFSFDEDGRLVPGGA